MNRFSRRSAGLWRYVITMVMSVALLGAGLPCWAEAAPTDCGATTVMMDPDHHHGGTAPAKANCLFACQVLPPAPSNLIAPSRVTHVAQRFDPPRVLRGISHRPQAPPPR